MGDGDSAVVAAVVTNQDGELKFTKTMRDKKIITSLALATAAVMSPDSANAQSADLLNTDFKASLYYYTEDNRVDSFGTIITADYLLNYKDTLSLKLSVDSLTGASASGAIATDRDQTFTTPSGNGSYVTPAGETPLDSSFLDTRYAVDAKWTRRWNANYKSTIGANFSKEYDYQSFGSSFLLDYNTDDSNTTYSGGISFSQDTIDPEGGIPTPFGLMQNVGAVQPRFDNSDDLTTVDLLLGVTQVIDSRSLFQFNYSLSSSDGYHSDPYKILSVVGADGRPLMQDPVTGLSSAVFEHRPDSRLKHSFYAQYKRDLFDDHVLDASYRFMFDDWGIQSHTFDLRYKYRLNETSYLQPHFRYYMQSEADFYEPFLLAGSAPAPGSEGTDASADYRLGEMNAFTLGLEYGWDNVERPWSVSVEYYLQDLSAHPVLANSF